MTTKAQWFVVRRTKFEDGEKALTRSSNARFVQVSPMTRGTVFVGAAGAAGGEPGGVEQPLLASAAVPITNPHKRRENDGENREKNKRFIESFDEVFVHDFIDVGWFWMFICL